MPNVSRLSANSFFESLQKIFQKEVSYAATLTSIALAALAYRSLKSTSCFRWPVAIAAGTGSAFFLMGLALYCTAPRTDETDSLVSPEKRSKKERASVTRPPTIIPSNRQSGVVSKNPSSKGMDPKGKEPVDEDRSLTNEILEENCGSKKEMVHKPDDLPKAILDLLHRKGCLKSEIQMAIMCCKELPNQRSDSDHFVNRVKRLLLIANEIRYILPMELRYGSEGRFVIASLVTEEEEKALLNRREMPKIFRKKLEAAANCWNILNPLRNEGYSLEELFLSFMHTLMGPRIGARLTPSAYQQAKQFIDTARQVVKLMKQYSKKDYPLAEIFFFSIAVRTQIGSEFDEILARKPETICSQIIKLLKDQASMQQIASCLMKKGYTQREITIAETWFQTAFSVNRIKEEPVPAIDSIQLEEIIKTTKELSILLEKHSAIKRSFEEILPVANDLRLERKQPLEEFLKDDPETLCKEVEEKIRLIKLSEFSAGLSLGIPPSFF